MRKRAHLHFETTVQLAFKEDYANSWKAPWDHLQEAQVQLQKAQHDKGGHRARALALVERAKAEVKAGMKFDETHEGKGKKGHNTGTQKPMQ
jgi:hypothetical protein